MFTTTSNLQNPIQTKRNFLEDFEMARGSGKQLLATCMVHIHLQMG